MLKKNACFLNNPFTLIKRVVTQNGLKHILDMEFLKSNEILLVATTNQLC